MDSAFGPGFRFRLFVLTLRVPSGRSRSKSRWRKQWRRAFPCATRHPAQVVGARGGRYGVKPGAGNVAPYLTRTIMQW